MRTVTCKTGTGGCGALLVELGGLLLSQAPLPPLALASRALGRRALRLLQPLRCEEDIRDLIKSCDNGSAARLSLAIHWPAGEPAIRPSSAPGAAPTHCSAPPHAPWRHPKNDMISILRRLKCLQAGLVLCGSGLGSCVVQTAEAHLGVVMIIRAEVCLHLHRRLVLFPTGLRDSSMEFQR